MSLEELDFDFDSYIVQSREMELVPFMRYVVDRGIPLWLRGKYILTYEETKKRNGSALEFSADQKEFVGKFVRKFSWFCFKQYEDRKPNLTVSGVRIRLMKIITQPVARDYLYGDNNER
tara:strand:+ start:11028 stop:11384 length:357 start_codon:yes stop_codon:yes gene_type:complete